MAWLTSGAAAQPAADGGQESSRELPNPSVARYGFGAAAGYTYRGGSEGYLLQLHGVGEVFRWLRLEPGVSYATTNHTKAQDFGRGEVLNSDTARDLVITLRALSVWPVTDWFFLRAGVIAGAGVSMLDSTVCGEQSLWRPAYGFSAGPGVRFGGRHPIDVDVHAEVLQGPHLTCVNGLFRDLRISWPGVREDDDLAVDALVRVSSLWW